MRVAVYYAPPLDSALWQLGSRWLGRDAASGSAHSAPPLAGGTSIGLDAECWRRWTASPRRYGLHATLKPPFTLRPEYGLDELCARLAAVLSPRRAFRLRLELAELSGFLALRAGAPPDPALQDLADACVVELDPLRQPPPAEELARRRRQSLSPRQDELLKRWGYPYVLDQFRFHITLTERLDDAERARARALLRALFGRAAGRPLDVTVDAVCLFTQANRDAPFMLWRRLPFAGA